VVENILTLCVLFNLTQMDPELYVQVNFRLTNETSLKNCDLWGLFSSSKGKARKDTKVQIAVEETLDQVMSDCITIC
jgi:hypothetical protein